MAGDYSRLGSSKQIGIAPRPPEAPQPSALRPDTPTRVSPGCIELPHAAGSLRVLLFQPPAAPAQPTPSARVAGRTRRTSGPGWRPAPRRRLDVGEEGPYLRPRFMGRPATPSVPFLTRGFHSSGAGAPAAVLPPAARSTPSRSPRLPQSSGAAPPFASADASRDRCRTWPAGTPSSGGPGRPGNDSGP